jgi:formylglycine-generating enzyme required for sulfatase activity
LRWSGKIKNAGAILSVMIIGIGVIAVQSGCDVDPAAPEFSNPFDPYNPTTGGDPFDLNATNTQEGVELQWNVVSGAAVDGYRLYRGVMDSVNLDVIAEMDRDLYSYLDTDCPLASIMWYRISATFSGGESSALPLEAVRVYTSPELMIESDSTYTNRQNVTLSIAAPRAQWMWLSNFVNFADGEWQPFDRETSWELPGDDGQKSVYLRVSYDDSSLSLPVHDEIILDRVAEILAFEVDLPESPIGLSEWIGATLSASDTNGSAWMELRSSGGILLYPPINLQPTSASHFGGGFEIRWGEDASDAHVEGHFVDGANNTADPEIWQETFDLSLGMVEIQAGPFPMGIDNMDPAEGPEHEVYLDDYWMDRYLVTNYQFAQFLSDGNSQYFASSPYQRIQNTGGGQFQAVEGFEHFPVVMVLWSEAVAYANWAGKRLPTEAEWEKAARGTDARVFPWGNADPMPDQANYLHSGDPWEEILVPPLSPCGYYNGRNYDGFQTVDSPGPYGNYDMAGDVWEWISDWFDPNYYASSPYENPQGPVTGTVKVIRGGDCLSVPYYLRSHIRYSPWGMEYRNANVGFRCVSSHP